MLHMFRYVLFKSFLSSLTHQHNPSMNYMSTSLQTNDRRTPNSNSTHFTARSNTLFLFECQQRKTSDWTTLRMSSSLRSRTAPSNVITTLTCTTTGTKMDIQSLSISHLCTSVTPYGPSLRRVKLCVFNLSKRSNKIIFTR